MVRERQGDGDLSMSQSPGVRGWPLALPLAGCVTLGGPFAGPQGLLANQAQGSQESLGHLERPMK